MTHNLTKELVIHPLFFLPFIYWNLKFVRTFISDQNILNQNRIIHMKSVQKNSMFTKIFNVCCFFALFLVARTCFSCCLLQCCLLLVAVLLFVVLFVCVLFVAVFFVACNFPYCFWLMQCYMLLVACCYKFIISALDYNVSQIFLIACT